jgi:hypothetical protein
MARRGWLMANSALSPAGGGGTPSAYLDVPGTSGDARTPVTAGNGAYSGYIDIRVKLEITSNPSTTKIFFGNNNAEGCDIYFTASRQLAALWFTGGSPVFPPTSTSAVVGLNTVIWVRVRLNTTGSTVLGLATNNCEYATSPDDVTYTVANTVSAFSAAVMADCTTTGSNFYGMGLEPTPLKVYALKIANATTTLVDCNYVGQTAGAGSFVDSTGFTWTINSPVALV